MRDEAVAEDEQQHREDEQVEVGEEAPVGRLVGHVAGRVDVDERADDGDDEDHDRRERIEANAMSTCSLPMCIIGKTPSSREPLAGRQRRASLTKAAIATSAGGADIDADGDGGDWRACRSAACSRSPKDPLSTAPTKRHERDQEEPASTVRWSAAVKVRPSQSLSVDVSLASMEWKWRKIDEHDRERDRRFGRGEHDDEQREHLPADRAPARSARRRRS